MANETSTPSSSTTLTSQQLREKAATIHTFDSFGRAIVAAALTQAAKINGASEQSSIAATVTITPIYQEGASRSGGIAASGAGGVATGTVPQQVSIAICIGDNCHFFGF